MMNTYHFQVQGQIDVADLNPLSPHQMTNLSAAPHDTRFMIYTDQSGMIGMLQHLHNLGLTIQSIVCQPAADDQPAVDSLSPSLQHKEN